MLREMVESDLFTVLELESLCFTSTWTKQMFLDELYTNDFSHLYVYEADGQIVGYIDFWTTFDCCQLANIAVSPTYRRRGFAKEMMDFMEEIAREELCEVAMLEVRVSNESAKALYESYGYIQMNIRKGYYNDNGEDAIVMGKAL